MLLIVDFSHSELHGQSQVVPSPTIWPPRALLGPSTMLARLLHKTPFPTHLHNLDLTLWLPQLVSQVSDLACSSLPNTHTDSS
jgi:hypothetical protein